MILYAVKYSHRAIRYGINYGKISDAQVRMGEKMNREEFMRELESLLQNLPATEREKAIQYYNEYFDDAGPENEQSVIEALGNPARVAENISPKINENRQELIAYPVNPGTEGGAQEQNAWENGAQNSVPQTSNVPKKEGMSTGMIVLIVLLCILASPAILGVASAGIGVAAGLIAGWFGLIIGFGITAVVLLVVWIALVIAGIIGLFTRPFVGMGLIGAGLLCGGVGLLFLMLTVAMAGIATPAICRFVVGLFRRESKQNTAGFEKGMVKD